MRLKTNIKYLTQHKHLLDTDILQKKERNRGVIEVCFMRHVTGNFIYHWLEGAKYPVCFCALMWVIMVTECTIYFMPLLCCVLGFLGERAGV